MKFKDNITGSILNITNQVVIEQCKKHPDKYTEIKESQKKADEKK